MIHGGLAIRITYRISLRSVGMMNMCGNILVHVSIIILSQICTPSSILCVTEEYAIGAGILLDE